MLVTSTKVTRAPLTVLSGFLETMRELPLAEKERARYLELMEQQASRMRHIVDDLLALAKLEGDAKPPNESQAHAIPHRPRRRCPEGRPRIIRRPAEIQAPGGLLLTEFRDALGVQKSERAQIRASIGA